MPRTGRPRSIQGSDEAIVIARYLAGESLAAIAVDFGGRREAVRRCLKRNGVARRLKWRGGPHPLLQGEEAARIVERYGAGESVEKIGRSLGCSTTTVLKCLRRCAVVVRPQNNELNAAAIRGAVAQDVVIRYLAGEVPRRIAATLGVTTSMLYACLKRHDIPRLPRGSRSSPRPVAEQLCARRAKYRDDAEYRQQVRDEAARWRRENPEAAKAARRRARARRRGAAGRHTPVDVLQKYIYQGGRCLYCRRPISWDAKCIDHMIALSRGGTDWPANLAIACAPCNLSKHARSIREFAGDRVLAARAAVGRFHLMDFL